MQRRALSAPSGSLFLLGWGSAHGLSLGLGAASAFGGAGADKIALHVREAAEYSQHQAPGAGAGVGPQMVRTIEEALALRDAGIGQIRVGDVHGRAPDNFDFGNSPFEISTVDFRGKTIIQRTSAATQGIVEAAPKAERLYAPR